MLTINDTKNHIINMYIMQLNRRYPYVRSDPFSYYVVQFTYYNLLKTYFLSDAETLETNTRYRTPA